MHVADVQHKLLPLGHLHVRWTVGAAHQELLVVPAHTNKAASFHFKLEITIKSVCLYISDYETMGAFTNGQKGSTDDIKFVCFISIKFKKFLLYVRF